MVTVNQKSSFAKQSLFSDLKTSTYHSVLSNPDIQNSAKCQNFQYGTFSWPSGASYQGEFFNGYRNGKGIQIWQDKSTYNGDFLNDMRHGYGIHKWSSGEVYQGQFFKDHRHGRGLYTWPGGTKFTGMFYLDRKEGYGEFLFANGDKFEGLYNMDERFGPGVLTYKDKSKGQEVGIWHREKLLKLCIPARHTFTMKNHPEYLYYPNEHKSKLNFSDTQDNKIHQIFVRESSSYSFLTNDFKASLFADNTAVPIGLEVYSSNFENLPLTFKHKEKFDKSYFGAIYDKMKNNLNLEYTATNNTPLLMEIEKHVIKHHCSSNAVEFDIDLVMESNRDQFKSNYGHLEILSQSLIDMAAEGNEKMVYSILKTGLVDPNVSDKNGNIALLNAAIHCHQNIVNILLDMGANVNKLTDEGMSALTACHIFYYPVDHFKPNGPEESIKIYEKMQALSKNKKEMKKSVANSKIIKNNEFPKITSAEAAESNDAKVSSDLSAVSTLQIEACKSDLKIIKSRHDKLLLQEKSQQFIEIENVLSNETIASISTELESEKPTFDSNQNVIRLEIDVTDNLIDQTAKLLSLNQQLTTGVTTRDGNVLNMGTASALAVWKAEHSQLHSMITLLLQRGANPNTGTVPYPALFFAVKAGDVSAVKDLLEKGAATEHRLSDKLFGLGMLHIAAGIRCPEGVSIVESLLKANADPNAFALDDFVPFDVMKREKVNDKTSEDSMSEISSISGDLSTSPNTASGFQEESGRTALHFACVRDDDYESCRQIVRLLLLHGANPDVNWSGHSPLTLAISSGSDLCIDELLAGGANPSFSLTRGVSSALCAAYNVAHEHRRTLKGRFALVDKMMAHGANILAPVQFGPKRLTGTVVDYAHWMFTSDKRIAHTPYHALSTEERATYTERRKLLSYIGDLLRQAAVDQEHARLLNEFKDGAKSQDQIKKAAKHRRFLYVGTRPDLLNQIRTDSAPKASDPELRQASTLERNRRESQYQERTGVAVSRVSFVPPDTPKHSADEMFSESGDENNKMKLATSHRRIKVKKELKHAPTWKPLFRYCYDCGRSVGVRLSPCSRCHEVFYCSRACKLKAWEERHKNECLRIKVHVTSPEPTPSEVAAIFADHTLDETMERARVKTESIIESLLNRQLIIAEENLLETITQKRTHGSRHHSRISTGRASSSRYRTYNASSSNRKRAPSSKKSSQSCRINVKQNPAKVSKYTRSKVGKDVVFGSTGMTLAELGIKENYSFE